MVVRRKKGGMLRLMVFPGTLMIFIFVLTSSSCGRRRFWKIGNSSAFVPVNQQNVRRQPANTEVSSIHNLTFKDVYIIVVTCCYTLLHYSCFFLPTNETPSTSRVVYIVIHCSWPPFLALPGRSEVRCSSWCPPLRKVQSQKSASHTATRLLIGNVRHNGLGPKRWRSTDQKAGLLERKPEKKW